MKKEYNNTYLLIRNLGLSFDSVKNMSKEEKELLVSLLKQQ